MSSTRKVWWRCEWCGAGGSVTTALEGNTVKDAMAVLRAVEAAHGREESALCHVMRHVQQVRVSETGPVPR